MNVEWLNFGLERQALLAMLFDLVEKLDEAVILTTPDPARPEILYVNRAFTDITGYGPDEALGNTPQMLQGPGTDRAALRRIRAALEAGEACREEVLNYGRDREPYWLDMHVVPLADDTGAPLAFAALERDVTAQRRRLTQLEKLAHEDVLTGLANRSALERRLGELLEPGGAETPAHGLVLFDLDGFKDVNDRHGHQAGDELLRRFAALVLSCVRRDDLVARLGGDEFAAIVECAGPGDARALAARVVRASERIQTARLGGGLVRASAGVTTFTAGEVADDVVARADRALYAAKAAGKSCVRTVTPRPQLVA